MLSLLAQKLTNPQLVDPFIDWDFGQYGSRMITLLMYLFFILCVFAFFFMFVWGGTEWIQSGGDKQKLENARSRLTNGIVGLLVLFLLFIAVRTTNTVFGVNLANWGVLTSGVGSGTIPSTPTSTPPPASLPTATPTGSILTPTPTTSYPKPKLATTHRVDFNPIIPVSTSQKYTIKFDRGSEGLNFFIASSNPYSGGVFMNNEGLVYNSDMVFKLYSCPDSSTLCDPCSIEQNIVSAGYGTYDLAGQSFTQLCNGNVNYVEFCTVANSTTPYEVQIRSGEGLYGTLLGTATAYDTGKLCPSCTSDAECDGAFICASAIDADGDGYYPDYVSGSGACKYYFDIDCNDTNPDVFPGQTTYFQDPIAVTGGFDYDCSGSEEKLPQWDCLSDIATFDVCQTTPYPDGDHKRGWLSQIPSCGTTVADNDTSGPPYWADCVSCENGCLGVASPGICFVPFDCTNYNLCVDSYEVYNFSYFSYENFGLNYSYTQTQYPYSKMPCK